MKNCSCRRVGLIKTSRPKKSKKKKIIKACIPRWLYDGVSLPSKMGDVFERHLFVRIAYLQGERQPLLGPSDADGKFGSGGVTNIILILYSSPRQNRISRRHRSPRAKAAFHPVSRQFVQTSGGRKRLPFSTGVITPLQSPWCIRSIKSDYYKKYL